MVWIDPSVLKAEAKILDLSWVSRLDSCGGRPCPTQFWENTFKNNCWTVGDHAEKSYGNNDASILERLCWVFCVFTKGNHLPNYMCKGIMKSYHAVYKVQMVHHLTHWQSYILRRNLPDQCCDLQGRNDKKKKPGNCIFTDGLKF